MVIWVNPIQHIRKETTETETVKSIERKFFETMAHCNPSGGKNVHKTENQIISEYSHNRHTNKVEVDWIKAFSDFPKTPNVTHA